MSWIRSSKSTALVVLFAVSLLAVGGATAISISAEGVPDGTQVGDPIEVTITMEDPFVDMPDTWTLRGSTDVQNVSWRVIVLQQGETIENGERTYTSGTFERPLNTSQGGDTVRIILEGDTPSVQKYTFDSKETFTLYDFDRATGNSSIDIESSDVYHYTNESKVAREEIVEAQNVINETGGTDQARTDLDNAKSFYNNEQFDRAISLAKDAQNKAESSQQSSQLLLFGGIGVVVIVIIGGAVYYWRSQQDTYGKLQ